VYGRAEVEQVEPDVTYAEKLKDHSFIRLEPINKAAVFLLRHDLSLGSGLKRQEITKRIAGMLTLRSS
jgi:hypothetical protein